MKHIILFLLLISQIFASVVTSTVKSIDGLTNTITIDINKIDVGMSGFIVHNIAPNHSIILKNVTVASFDKDSNIATLTMSKFDDLQNPALPSGTWNVKVGDKVILAFGYSRALLIAPDEEIYHRITKAIKVQWVHPDLFTSILSFEGHLSPTKDDFLRMNKNTSIGLIYFFIKQKLYTVDAKSLKILAISQAPLKEDSTELPFYTRIKKLDNSWWDFGDGTKKVKNYNSYYYNLLLKYNPKNQQLINEMKK